MYKRVETVQSITLDNGSEVAPVATLADEYGGVSHWIVDDHCYVLVNMFQPKDGYPADQEPKPYGKMVAWIYAEALDVLKELPPLR